MTSDNPAPNPPTDSPTDPKGSTDPHGLTDPQGSTDPKFSTDPQGPPEPAPVEPMVLLSPDAPESVKDRLLWLGVLVLLAATAFIPAIRGDFIWQDDTHVTRNILVVAPDAIGQIWTGHVSELFGADTTVDPLGPAAQGAAPARKLPVTPHFQPLGYSLLWLEFQAFGPDPLVFHAVQVALHAIGVLLFWLVLRNLRLPGAWVAASVFAVHPLNAEAVAWVSQTPLVLGVALMMGAVLFYLESSDVSNGELKQSFLKPVLKDETTAHTIALVLFALAVLAKPTLAPVALVLPVLLWGVGKKLDGKEWGRIVPMIVIGAVALLIYVMVELRATSAPGDAAPHLDLPGLGTSAWFYFFKVLFPFGLTFGYADPVSGVVGGLGLVVALGVLGVLIVRAKKLDTPVARGAVVVVGAYLILLSTQGGLVPSTEHAQSLLGDRFAYLPGMVLIAGGVAVVARYVGTISTSQEGRSSRARGVFGAGAVVLVALTSLTWARSNLLSDPVSLWRDTIARNPSSFLAHYELGNLQMRFATEAFQSAAQLRAQNALDDAAQLQRESDSLFAEADALFASAVEIRPQSPEAWVGRGKVWFMQNNLDSAEAAFRSALQTDPSHVDANYHLGVALMERYRASDNLMEFAQRQRFNRAFPLLTGWLHQWLGDGSDLLDAARGHFETALRTDPRHGESMYELGRIYLDLSNDEAASLYLRGAITYRPDFVRAHRLLATLYRQYGQYREALFHLTRVYQLSPATVELQIEMGRAVGLIGDFQLSRQWFQQALAIQPNNPDARQGYLMADRMLTPRGATTTPITAPTTAPTTAPR